MRFIIMHKTSAHWEAGAIPSAELIARVRTLIGELAHRGLLLGAEGLRASAHGIRLKFVLGKRTVINGPFAGGNELPAGFTIVRVRSIDDAIAWASRQAAILGDVEIDIRPVTEPWDVGIGSKPANVTTARYMILWKATVDTESGNAPSSSQRAKLSQLIQEATHASEHLVTETLRPSVRGRRYKNSRDGITFFDGPFVESKELIAGYVIVSAASLDDAGRWASRYIETVQSDEVDVRELV